MGIKWDSERKEIEKLDKPAWVYSSEHRDREQNEEFIRVIRDKKGKEE